MSNSLYSHIRDIGVISLLTHQGICAAIPAHATCYSTPRTAIDAVATKPLSSPALESSGYRITGVRLDSVLGERWATIVSCEHPEWPPLALPTNGAGPLIQPQEAGRSLTELVRAAPVVRAGELVRLWRQESLLRIEVDGISEESGTLGTTIRVRLLRRNMNDQSTPQQFTGVVRGPSNVEILP
jgi:Chaperone for flagella basal body P-ring formation